MPRGQHFNVIIIGTGAGGGTLAHRLAPFGKRILLLERGDWLRREKDNWESRAVFLEAKYRANETLVRSRRPPVSPGDPLLRRWEHEDARGGPATAAQGRLRRDPPPRRHPPAWPLSYEDFEPYYTEAEHLYHVHGRHGVDPTEPSASAPYRHPPVSHEPRIQDLADSL